MTFDTYRRVRRIDQATDLDRSNWAELGAVEFDQIVYGSGGHLTPEPIMFGRAFDSPPILTYSGNSLVFETAYGTLSPIVFIDTARQSFLTIGVAEWIIDPQGMYVGANLWYKIDADTEHLPSPIDVTPLPGVAEKIVLDRSDAGFLDSPDNSSTNFSTSLELIIKWAPNDWTDIRQVFCSAHDGGFETGYRWQMGPLEASNFFWWSGGVLRGSAVLGPEDPNKDWVPIVDDGVPVYMRLTFDASGGQTTINHYDRRLSTDPWRLILNHVQGSAFAINPTSGHPMRVGGDSSPAAGYIDGDLYFIQFFDAEGGTLKAEVRASDFEIGDKEGDSAADFSGRVWTLRNGGLVV